jgi:hypothetical protein
MKGKLNLQQNINLFNRRLRSFFLQSKVFIRAFFFAKRHKIFVLSFQRSGTKSTAMFFREHGYLVCGWSKAKKHSWGLNWLKGEYDSIFNSVDFKGSQVFEDAPWFYPGFYKVLFLRFPNSKFVFLERNSDKWFNSMMSHSHQRVLGSTHLHAVIYERMDEFNLKPELGLFENSIANGLPLTEEYREHYKAIYKKSIDEMKLFFNQHDPNGKQFFYGHLEDKNVWTLLGSFIGISIKEGKVFHTHKTGKEVKLAQ